MNRRQWLLPQGGGSPVRLSRRNARVEKPTARKPEEEPGTNPQFPPTLAPPDVLRQTVESHRRDQDRELPEPSGSAQPAHRRERQAKTQPPAKSPRPARKGRFSSLFVGHPGRSGDQRQERPVDRAKPSPADQVRRRTGTPTGGRPDGRSGIAHPPGRLLQPQAAWAPQQVRR